MADDWQFADDLQRLQRRLFERSGRREGREVRFLCPGHDDRNPSARYNLEKSTWFCHVCHQGGGWRDLAGRLGEAAPAGRGGGGSGGGGNGVGGREVEAVYAYEDDGGRLLYQVLRYRPKVFACRRPDGAGGWAWDLREVRRVLYRLPQVVAAVHAGEIVFVVEGEKDADALQALGLAATTHAGGAGKWRPEYVDALRGGSVVLLPDNDEVGRRHMETVANALRPEAAAVAHLNLPGLPEKGDVSDWIAGRRGEGVGDESSRGELLVMARRALAGGSGGPTTVGGADSGGTLLPPASAAVGPSLGGRVSAGTGAVTPGIRSVVAGPAAPAAPSAVRRLSDVVPQPVHFLWYPYLPLGKLTLLDGDPGEGKSWLTAALATAGSRGRGLPGSGPFVPFNSLFFAEDPAEDVLRPRLDRLGADCTRVFSCDTFEHPLDLAQGGDVAYIEQLVAEHAVRLVVVDPIQAFLGAKTDIYRPNEVRSVLAPLLRLAQRHGCALLVLRHITKARASRSLYAGQGSVDFIAAARSVLLAGSGPDNPARRALVHLKSNLAAPGATLGYRFDGDSFCWEGTSTLTANDLLAGETASDEAGAEEEARVFLRELLAAHTLPARTVLTHAREAGIAERTLKRAKRREAIRTTRQGFGAGSVWLWSLPEGPEADEGGQPETWPSSLEAGPVRAEGGDAGGGGDGTEAEGGAGDSAEDP